MRRRKIFLQEAKPVTDLKLIADIIEKPKYNTGSRYKVKLTDRILSRIKFYLEDNEAKRLEGKVKQQRKKLISLRL